MKHVTLKILRSNQIHIGSRGHKHDHYHNNNINNNHNHNRNNKAEPWRGFPATELPSTVILLETGTHCAVQADGQTHRDGQYTL